MTAGSPAEIVVGKGSVGESGPTAMIHYTVKAKTDITMLVKTVETSLWAIRAHLP